MLCAHYKISLDQFIHLETDAVIFNGRNASNTGFDFEQYLEGILKNVQYMNSFPEREMLYLNKDIPVFYHFIFPELTAFKSFFWKRSILNYPAYANKRFDLNEPVSSTIQQIGQQLVIAYNQLPSQEIWNIESINSTIRQIEYYKKVHADQCGGRKGA